MNKDVLLAVEDVTLRFGSVNAIDCRNPRALYVAEAGNWRVTKVDLH